MEFFGKGLDAKSSGDNNKTIEYMSRALVEFCAVADTHQFKAGCYVMTAEAFNELGKYKNALQNYENAIGVLKQMQDTDVKILGRCYQMIGDILIELGENENAIDNIERAIIIYETAGGFQDKLAECYCALGMAAFALGKFEKSIENNNRAAIIYDGIGGHEYQYALCLYGLGDAYRQLERYENAILSFEKALELYNLLNNTIYDQAYCHMSIGFSYSEGNQPRNAIKHLVAALRLFDQAEEDATDMQILCSGKLGELTYDLALKGNATQVLGDLVQNDVVKTNYYMGVGHRLYEIEEYDAAMAMFEQALNVNVGEVTTDDIAAECHYFTGCCLKEMAKYDPAIHSFRKARRVFESMQNTNEEIARCDRQIGSLLAELGNYVEGMRMIKAALDRLTTNHGSSGELAHCYMTIGSIFSELNNVEVAIQFMVIALAIWSEIPDAEYERTICRMNISTVLLQLCKYEHALTVNREVLATQDNGELSNKLAAFTYSNMGAALFGLGAYHDAISHYKKALSIYQQREWQQGREAECLEGMACCFNKMKRIVEAISCAEDAMRIRRKMSASVHLDANCWNIVGDMFLKGRRYTEAIWAFLQAVRCSGGWYSYAGLGEAYRRRGSAGDAEKTLQALLTALKIEKDLNEMILANENRTVVFENTRIIYERIIGALLEFAASGRKLSNKDILRWAMTKNMTQAPVEAAFHYTDRGKGRVLRSILINRKSGSEGKYSEELNGMDNELSMEISETYTAGLGLRMDQLGERDRLYSQIEELQLLRNIAEGERKYISVDSYVSPEYRLPMEMASELEEATAVLQYVIGAKQSLVLVMTRSGVKAYDLHIRKRALPELLEKQRASKGELIKACRERFDELGLHGLVTVARETVCERNTAYGITESDILSRLGRVIVPDVVLEDLRRCGIGHLAIVPDDVLHYVPFAMLRIGNGAKEHYIVEEFATSYVTSMSTLDTIRRENKKKEDGGQWENGGVLAFANPNFSRTHAIKPDDMATRSRYVSFSYYSKRGLQLNAIPGTEQEALGVASLFGPVRQYGNTRFEIPFGGSIVFTGAGACELQVKSILGELDSSSEKRRWRYLLFSTHGFADERNGMLSCLALSSNLSGSTEDGFLQAQEVMRLDLNCELVMLSACQTGLGRMHSGEGMIGLSSAFLVAGAHSVCASLWQVPSGPTCELVIGFFDRLREGKISKGEALRQAQLALLRGEGTYDRKSSEYSMPYCWAGFVLMGEYR